VATSEAESCIELLLESAGLFDDNDFCSAQSVSKSTNTDDNADLQADNNIDTRVKEKSGYESCDDGVAPTEVNKNVGLICCNKLHQAASYNCTIYVFDAEKREGLSKSNANVANENWSNLGDQCNSNEQHDSSSENNAEQTRIGTRHHGLHSRCPTLHINVAKDVSIQETDDNFVLIRNLQDQYSLLSNRYLPAAKKWLEVRTCSVLDLNEDLLRFCSFGFTYIFYHNLFIITSNDYPNK